MVEKLEKCTRMKFCFNLKKKWDWNIYHDFRNVWKMCINPHPSFWVVGMPNWKLMELSLKMTNEQEDCQCHLHLKPSHKFCNASMIVGQFTILQWCFEAALGRYPMEKAHPVERITLQCTMITHHHTVRSLSSNFLLKSWWLYYLILRSQRI